MSDKVLEMYNLNKVYGEGDTKVHALQDVSITVNKGEFLLIVGSSGSGKSTLLNMIGLLDRPTSGKILIDGTNITTLNDGKISSFRNHKLGFIFQFFNLLTDLTVLENIMLPRQIQGTNGSASKDAKELLKIVGLDDQMYKRANKISGGQAQRAAIAMANVGTQDITGIKGQLSLPFGFSPTAGSGPLIEADFDSTALAGEVFELTFFVDISDQAEIKQYPASAMIEYSRLRESGARNTFFDFNFKVTGDSIINMQALEPFLTSFKKNHVVIEISNDGTAPISGVSIELQNTQETISSTSQSVTNVEHVVILDSDWDVGQIDSGKSKYLEFDVYVPGTLSAQTLRAPMKITYFNAHGEQLTISRIVDFYVKGLIDPTIYDVGIIDFSGKPPVVGEIINEGNEDALFGFVTLEPLGDSNIKKSTQYIDEI